MIRVWRCDACSSLTLPRTFNANVNDRAPRPQRPIVNVHDRALAPQRPIVIVYDRALAEERKRQGAVGLSALS